MKKFAATALLLLSTTSYAVMLGSGNNMGAEAAPKRDNSANSVMTDTDRRTYTPPTSTYGEETSGYRNDSISTGQAATRRNNSIDTPTTRTMPTTTCVDSNGFAYYKNDSGYAACVNQRSNKTK